MGWREFAASLFGSLAWPLTIFASILVLRRAVSSALAGGVKRLKVGPSGVEIDFDAVDALRAGVEQEQAMLPPAAESEGSPGATREFSESAVDLARIETSPTASFVASFIDLERSLRQVLLKRNVDISRLTAHHLGEFAEAHDLFTEADRKAFDQLRAARNEVVHGMGEDLTVGQSVSLVALARALNETVLRRLHALGSG